MTAFTYKGCTVVDVHDGDTFTAEIPTGGKLRTRHTIDRGLHLYVRADGIEVWRWPVRLNGCNAPELATPAGPPAHVHLASLISGQTLTITTHLVQTEKYGRVLGDVILPDGRDVSAVMIADGYAAVWNGEGKKPVPA